MTGEHRGLIRKLEATQRRYAKASELAQLRLLERDVLVLEALRAGVPGNQIAEATGITEGRVSQLKRASTQGPARPADK